MSFDSMSSIFAQTFIGSHVELLTRFKTSELEAITTYQVFLLDADNDYYFVGETPDEVTAAIRKSTVFSIEFVKTVDKNREALEKFSVAGRNEN